MRLKLYTSNDQLVGTLDDDEKMLGYYPVADFMRIEVVGMGRAFCLYMGTYY